MSRNCSNCTHYKKRGNQLPCRNCFDVEHWEPMTNADRIPSMTDKELANELTGIFVRFKTDEAAMGGKYLTATELSAARDTYFFVLLRWLQQPVKEGAEG